ncbi:MAG: hypothetical protein WAU86_21265 [Oricola sp.]
MPADQFPTSDRKSRLQARLLAANLAAAVLVIAAIAGVPTGSRVVVVAPPWSTPDRVVSIIANAGGTLVNGGRSPWLAVAEGSSPDFVKQLFSAGALFILNGRLAAACIEGTSE